MTTIISFKEIDNYNLFIDKDINNREIGLAEFHSVKLTGRNLFYPNVLLYLNNDINDINDINDNKYLINPYDEKIMSLNKITFYDNNIFDIPTNIKKKTFETINIIKYPVFFFIYNFDNYYHFLYDTLPYLYMYFHLKQIYPELKLLVNYPNFNKKEFYKFNIDILSKFIDMNNDIIIHNSANLYKTLFVSSSLTHGGLSNVAPRNEIFELYSKMSNTIIINPYYNEYEYIYISRRTWIHNDTSNIGTNYTTRRKMINEDNLVEQLTMLGVKEVFTEHLTIDEKIHLFSRAKIIIGSIGGGMANLLFSNSETKSIVIVTPDFLNINYRFKYSMEHTDITYFNEVKTYSETNTIPLFCRVKIIKEGDYHNKIGEIFEYDKETMEYKIHISNNDVAGFNNDITFEYKSFTKNDLELLDNGLNSPYIVDIPPLISIVKGKMDYNSISLDNKCYNIFNKTKNSHFYLSIDEIIILIRETVDDEYYKDINGVLIKINNDIVINTNFICHRINTIEELQTIPSLFGVEVDIRDSLLTNSLILSHDPFKSGAIFKEYFNHYFHKHFKDKNIINTINTINTINKITNTIILNIKSERTELECLKIMEENNFTDYFFLDSNLPMIYLLNKKYNNKNIACRYSEFEPFENYEKIKDMISWIWVDCFTVFPLNHIVYNQFKNDNKKICLVSPELQNQFEKINEYREYIIQNNIIPDSICCKLYNIIHWI
jgi:hypothetical protein